MILTNIPEIIKNTTQKIKRNINITGNRIYYQSITVKKILFTALIESLIIFQLNSLFAARLITLEKIEKMKQNLIKLHTLKCLKYYESKKYFI